MEPTFLGQIAAWSHPARQTARGRVLLIHGITEHSGRHKNTIQALVGNGFAVTRFDLRGAGRSGGMRQWIDRFEDYVDDTITVYNWICRTEEDLPLFVLGHSLGGAVAMHFAALYDRALHGLVLTAPAYLVGSAISPLTIAAGRVLAKITPSFPLPRAADAGWVSRDREVVDAYVNDPLCCHANTFRQGAEVLNALEKMPELAERVLSPTLLAHGSHDRIIRLEGSFDLLRRMGGGDRTMHVIPGSYHEIHNDLDQQTWFSLLVPWLARQASSV